DAPGHAGPQEPRGVHEPEHGGPAPGDGDRPGDRRVDAHRDAGQEADRLPAGWAGGGRCGSGVVGPRRADQVRPAPGPGSRPAPDRASRERAGRGVSRLASWERERAEFWKKTPLAHAPGSPKYNSPMLPFDPSELVRYGGLTLIARQVVEGFLS